MPSQAEKKPRRERCPCCGKLRDDVTLGEDPFSADVYDDHAEVWLCAECRYERLQDI